MKVEIIALEDRIAQRQEVLKNRAVSFQESGGNVDVVEVLFGSTNFSDFISRVGAVATIVEADQDILKQQELDKAELEEKKNAVQNKLNNLKEMQVELKGMQAQIEDQKEQSEKVIADLAVKEKEATALENSLSKKMLILLLQLASIKAKQTKQQRAKQHRKIFK